PEIYTRGASSQESDVTQRKNKDGERNATHAAEAANHADRAANQGKQTVQHTADAIAALAQEIAPPVTGGQTWSKDLFFIPTP
ncbi:hypothetical protein, partial [Pseudomonas peli]|uniref:hypothetical protein n=1 Tax=Pseudomonas peli TaxID=592361 RepID=UPI003D3104C3